MSTTLSSAARRSASASRAWCTLQTPTSAKLVTPARSYATSPFGLADSAPPPSQSTPSSNRPSHAERMWNNTRGHSVRRADPVKQRKTDEERVQQQIMESLRTAFRENNFSEAWALYRNICRTGHTHLLNIRDWNSLIRMRRVVEVVWGRSASYPHKIKDIREILRKMQEAGVKPEVGTYVLIASIHAREGHVAETEAEFRTIESLGYPRPAVARTMLAQAKAHSIAHWDEALSELQSMTSSSTSAEEGAIMGLYNALLTSALSQKDFTRYQKTIDLGTSLNIKPDGATWDAMISFEALRNPEEAHKLLQRKARENPELGRTVRSYNAILRGFVNKESTTKALAIFNEMERYRVLANTATYNIMLSAYGKSRDPVAVMRIYIAMLAAKINANRQSHQLLAKACAPKITTEGDVRKLIRSAGGFPNRILYRALLEGFSANSENEKATIVYREFKRENSIDPEKWPMKAEIYSAGVSAYCRVGKVEEAEVVLEEAKSKGLTLTRFMGNAMLYAYTQPSVRSDPSYKEKCRQVFEELKNSKGNEPDASIYALLARGETGEGKELSEGAVEYLREFGQLLREGK
ncbi:hypothetical protein HK097_004548, partial [Rhizophlyctis rosea]